MQNNLITSWFHNRDYLNSLSRDVLFFTPTPRMTGFQIGGFGFFFGLVFSLRTNISNVLPQE